MQSAVSSSTTSCSHFLTVPSGKRAQGEGCEDASQVGCLGCFVSSCVFRCFAGRVHAEMGVLPESMTITLQGILAAHFSPSTRTAVLQITYLAAGFLIGEKGQSIRDMERITSTSIKSWKDRTVEGRSVRKLVIESVGDVGEDEDGGLGERLGMENVARCLHIIKAAVMHYKDLCEGLYCGEYVEPVRVIEGVAFHYCPPPRKMVPYAAGITVKASKVVDTYGGGVAEVPSRYKKEVRGAPWNGSHEVLDILGWEGVGVDANRGVPGMDEMARISEKKAKGSKTRRKEARTKRGDRKGSGGERNVTERGMGEEKDDGRREEELQPLHKHPEFGLFEVPCDEDYQPKEWDWTRRRQRQRYVTVAVLDGLGDERVSVHRSHSLRTSDICTHAHMHISTLAGFPMRTMTCRSCCQIRQSLVVRLARQACTRPPRRIHGRTRCGVRIASIRFARRSLRLGHVPGRRHHLV